MASRIESNVDYWPLLRRHVSYPCADKRGACGRRLDQRPRNIETIIAGLYLLVVPKAVVACGLNIIHGWTERRVLAIVHKVYNSRFNRKPRGQFVDVTSQVLFLTVKSSFWAWCLFLLDKIFGRTGGLQTYLHQHVTLFRASRLLKFSLNAKNTTPVFTPPWVEWNAFGFTNLVLDTFKVSSAFNSVA